MKQLEKMCNLIKTKGLKLTPARRLMMKIFLNSGNKLLNASEIYDQVRGKNSRTNFSTIYRNLELLVDHGIIEKLHLGLEAQYMLLDEDSCRHHMICTVCHKIEPLPYCPLKDLENYIRHEHDFIPTEHRVEIYGYCKKCNEKIK